MLIKDTLAMRSKDNKSRTIADNRPNKRNTVKDLNPKTRESKVIIKIIKEDNKMDCRREEGRGI